MNDPSTCTPCSLNVLSRVAKSAPAELNSLKTDFSPSAVTDSTPTSAPLIRALRIASRNCVSSPASIVICVKKTMSEGSFASFSINSNRSARMRLQFRDAMRVALLFGELNIGQGDGIEVIVGQRDEAKPETPQLHDLLDHHVGRALPRLLSVGTPHRTERTMFGATAHRLHGGPHVTIARSEIPARGQKLLSRNASAVVNRLGRAVAPDRRSPWPKRRLRRL